ncbi:MULTISPECIES: nicotinate-nucleotide adenylyltransferase [Xanthomonas]|uniref:Probable nicotinate-nucleotide adenylyltransferase n=1 Tax=Xanthomonas dyei TaxID=743699 RepID=A0ABZ0D9U7_9XANT|nr:nicotinate-nucleotide adenylyltransferase [Xanthomonas dyei]MCC4632388.1 nicotinate-nucleotide adenylyltransferase [Xanthomonas dyei pv. eucalypti]WOB25083.1 nicotinate-nucleotide adenylyltransferase [Xanthomonas dyei]WOB52710.1 nicotinate-nucleotide adenylyltransferase [Xanthomonas dyei]
MRAGKAGTGDRGPGAGESIEAEAVDSAASPGSQPENPAIAVSGSPVPGPRSLQKEQHPHQPTDQGPAPRSSGSPVPGPRSRLQESRLHLYYGGTFDPIHLGHLAIACAARDELGALVHLVPAADPPHRAVPGATAAQRAQMLELALAGQPGLQLDSRELLRASQQLAPSYTVDTLRELRELLGPATPIAWLLGADAFVGLHRWHQWEALFELAHFVIAARPGTSLDLSDAPHLAAAVQGRWAASTDALFAAPAGRLWQLHHPLRGESASAVRAQIAAGRAWQALVPAAVAGFIAREGLYGCARAAS